MEASELWRQWNPAIVSFMLVSAAIYALMHAVKGTMKNFEVYQNSVYQAFEPILPLIMGMAIAPSMGPKVVPIELPFFAHLGAGAMMGVSAVYIYEFWRNTLKGALDATKAWFLTFIRTRANLTKEQDDDGP